MSVFLIKLSDTKIDKTQVGVWAFIVLVMIGLAVFVRLERYPLSENTISAKVINVVDKPNQAEDGFYDVPEYVYYFKFEFE